MKIRLTVQRIQSWSTLVVASACLAYGASASQVASSKPDFQRDIQPILKAHCSPCHFGTQKAGGLSFDSYQALMARGSSGKALIPGQSKRGTLMARILGESGKPRMPLGFKPLSTLDTQTIRSWIDAGAMKGETALVKNHWAFVVPVRPKLPTVKLATWTRNPIDAFVLARLEQNAMKPSPEADKTTLLRRLSLDLIGLPPTPAEVDQFLADRTPMAYEKQVDRLLASPHYGERMALPWLDAARYADSNGFQQDGDTYQYIWRDWVVKALNANMPFDQFTIEQLAGDLLPKPSRDQLIATAFNRNHMLNGEGGAIAEEQRNVILYDRVDTTATTWLGLTMACARCHDHKYDPISQKDFYRFLAYFNNVPESGVPSGGGQYRIADPWIYVASLDEEQKIKQLQEQLIGRSGDEKKKIEAAIEQIRSQWPRVMVMSDKQPRKTHIQNRGNYLEPLEEVLPAPPTYLSRDKGAKTRLELARWTVSKRNPLTARVQVNRYWQLFFGRGLVRTEENFGIKGEAPTHPELLDWLAVEFQDSGWNVKKLHKLIVMSSTYRQSSKQTTILREKDPTNVLFGRAPRFRLPSMLLRDVALASSGLLNPTLGG